MHPVLFQKALINEAATAEFATLLASVFVRGDIALLEGDIGAGKTAFARAFIRAKLGRAEDVPSPTFTLVQTYETADEEIWHCDLYRLSHPDEAFELGLEDAFETAICLIEWPDRLGNAVPLTALQLSFSAGNDAHHVVVSGAPEWAERLRRVHG